MPRMERPSALQRMIDAGEIRVPARTGMPDLIPDLESGTESLSDLLIAERDRERHRS